MKLVKTLTIASQTYHLVDDRVILGINTAGRAQFTIDTNGETIKPFTAIALDIGYTQHEYDTRLFVGYIETVNRRDNRQSVLFCREFAAVLNNTVPMNLRHPTLDDVLAEISDKTDLKFITPDQAYTSFKIPHFASLGNGYLALDAIGRAFKVPDYFWQQQPDGSIYVGSWADSVWPERDIELPDEYFDDQHDKTAVIPAVPSLRPGAVLNGQRVKQVDFADNFMTVTWV